MTDGNIDDGGPAFPRITTGEAVRNFGSKGAGFDLKFKSSEGVTLREYFAAKAMLGLLNSTAVDTQSIALHVESLSTGVQHDELIASRAYAIADAMLEARKR